PERTKATAQSPGAVPAPPAAAPPAPAPSGAARRGPPRPPARPAAPARSPILPIAVAVAGLLFVGLGGTLLYRSGLIPGLGRPVPTPPLPQPTAVPTPGLPLPTPTAVFPPATPFPGPTVVPTEAPPLPTPRVEPTKPIVVKVPTPRPTVRVAAERPTPTAAAGDGLCVQMGPTSFAQGKTRGFAPGFDVGSGPQTRAAKPDSGLFQIEFEVRPRRPQPGQLVTIEAYFANEAERDLALDHVEENVGMSVTNFRPVTSPPPPAKVRVGRKEPLWAFQGPIGASFLKTIKVTDGSGDSWSRTLEIGPCP
ncbi:MAG: hypothetical protein KBB14_19025, partial [Thermoanaerobaculia bacterium]|nr:hypothetical protein [Thermoanaerobaculia bacterium]